MILALGVLTAALVFTAGVPGWRSVEASALREGCSQPAWYPMAAPAISDFAKVYVRDLAVTTDGAAWALVIGLNSGSDWKDFIAHWDGARNGPSLHSPPRPGAGALRVWQVWDPTMCGR